MPPGPRGYPLLGVLPAMRRDPLACFTEAARRYGDIVSLRLGPLQTYLLCHPDHIQLVLQDQHRRFRKSRFVEKVKPFLGEGLATSDGDAWRIQRRLVQPAFHRQQIAALAGVVTGTVGEMLERWRAPAAVGMPVDLRTHMMTLTGEVILRTMFGVTSSEMGRGLLDDFEHVMRYCLDRVLAVVDWDAWLATPARRRFRAALRRLDETVWGIIAARRREDQDRGDLLSMLLSARDDESGAVMTDQQLRDDVMTIFFAGHETTGLALTWTWHLLSGHPDVERRLVAEVDQVLAGRTPAFDDLPRLAYTRRVIEESMRLYPPSWIISRAPVDDTEIGGYRLPAGSTLFMSQYVTHRHPAFWDDPERFDPDRFAPAAAAARPRYAYFPFSGGPRQCIGDQFALMEAQLVVAMVVQRYRLRACSLQPLRALPLLTLRPQSAVMMTLEPRPAAA